MSRARDVLLALVVVAALAFLAPGVLARIDTDLRDAVGGVRQASGAGATSEGWSQVQSAYELSGPLSREGLGYLLAAGLRGGHPCLLEMTPGTSLQCRTMLDTNGPVTALAGHGEWMLAATGASGNAPRTWTADTAYVRAPDADAAEGRHVPVNGSLPADARITAAAIDDDSYFPVVAGTVPAGATQRLQVWSVTDTVQGIAAPGGALCCEVRPGSAVVAAGTDPDILVAAEVRGASSTEPFTVHAWWGSSDDSAPEGSWEWQDVPLPTAMERVSDAQGQTLDHWLAGSTHGRAVVITTRSTSRGLVSVPLPVAELDPERPTVLLARTSFLDDGLVLAVQTADGPQVWIRPDSGTWSSAPLPAGTILDAETVEDTTYVTIRGEDGIRLWSKRLLPAAR